VRTIAIVAAMPEELAPLRARLLAPTRSQSGGLTVERGRLGGHDVALAATGDGARNARAGIATLLAAANARALVVLGVSGALSPALATADLVVASRVTDEDGGVHEADAAQVAAIARATGGRPAAILSARKIVDTAEEKRRLAAGLADGLAVVDLESASYVAAAEVAGIPWIVLRAVSDTADETLPPLLNRSLDAGGAVSRGRVLRGLISDPGALPTLLALRKRVGRCAEVLARAAEAALPACAPERGAA
jgi:adenosylhomocysteine nucleosidase